MRRPFMGAVARWFGGALAWVLALAALAAPVYRVSELPVPTGWQLKYSGGMNNVGQIVGTIVGKRDVPVVWEGPDHTMRRLVVPPGFNATANAINDAGQVVGAYESIPVAVRWDASGSPEILGDLPGSLFHSGAYGINSHGDVVGVGVVPDPIQPRTNRNHAFLWVAGLGMSDLGALPNGSPTSIAYAVNAARWVAGGGTSRTQAAFVWMPGAGMHLLAPSSSTAVGINDSGQVVGSMGDGQSHGFLWTPGRGLVDLGTIDAGDIVRPIGVNASGQVVGALFKADGRGTAFVWTIADGMLDVADCIDPSDPLRPALLSGPLDAAAVNDLGQIEIILNVFGEPPRAFVLTPGP